MYAMKTRCCCLCVT